MENMEKCMICLEDCSTTIVSIFCNCHLILHKRCFLEWLAIENKCLICRRVYHYDFRPLLKGIIRIIIFFGQMAKMSLFFGFYDSFYESFKFISYFFLPFFLLSFIFLVLEKWTRECAKDCYQSITFSIKFKEIVR